MLPKLALDYLPLLTFLALTGRCKSRDLTLKFSESAGTSVSEELKAVLDWRGAAEPIGNVPTMGMDDQQSLQMLVNGLFSQADKMTGLVNITRWVDTQDSQSLRVGIENAMKTK